MTPADGVEPSPPQELPLCRRHHVSVIATTSLGPQGPSCLLPVAPPFLCTRPPPAHWEVVVCSPGALPPIVIDVMLSSSPPAPTTACCCVLYRNSDIAPFFHSFSTPWRDQACTSNVWLWRLTAFRESGRELLLNASTLLRSSCADVSSTESKFLIHFLIFGSREQPAWPFV